MAREKTRPAQANRARPNRSNAVQRKPPPPTTTRGRATRDRLKTALLSLLKDRSFHDIRLEDITELAGVRVSLFYHYFQSKIDITQEVISETINTFQDEVANRPRGGTAFESIHFANIRMVHLYATFPGVMRCVLEARDGMTPFAPLWRQMTLGWNRRIADNVRRNYPDVFGDYASYLALAYALAGSVDNFLFEYYVLRNPELSEAMPTGDEVAQFLTALWCRTLFLENPPAEFVGRFVSLTRLAPTPIQASA